MIENSERTREGAPVPPVAETPGNAHAPVAADGTGDAGFGSALGGGGVYAMLPVAAVCSGCSRTEEMSYAIDLQALARRRKGIEPKAVTRAERDVHETLSESGWLVSGGRVYCPDCAARLGEGDLSAIRPATDARGLVSELATIIKSKTGRLGR